LTLALVRDSRELREPSGADEVAAFETDVLAGFVLARVSAGLADSTIRNGAGHLDLIRDSFGRPLWEMQPEDADTYFGRVLRDAKLSTRTRRRMYPVTVSTIGDPLASGAPMPAGLAAAMAPPGIVPAPAVAVAATAIGERFIARRYYDDIDEDGKPTSNAQCVVVGVQDSRVEWAFADTGTHVPFDSFDISETNRYVRKGA